MKSVSSSLFSALILTLAIATFSTAAFAHPGPHDDIDSVSDMLGHIVGSPDHASWLILAATAVLSVLAIKTAIRIATPGKSDENR